VIKETPTNVIKETHLEPVTFHQFGKTAENAETVELIVEIEEIAEWIAEGEKEAVIVVEPPAEETAWHLLEDRLTIATRTTVEALGIPTPTTAASASASGLTSRIQEVDRATSEEHLRMLEEEEQQEEDTEKQPQGLTFKNNKH
jgi:predicted peptidase